MEYLNRSGNCVEMIKLLADGRADLSLTSENGWSCLHYAACHSNPEFLEVLLKRSTLDILSLATTKATRTAPKNCTAENLALLKNNIPAQKLLSAYALTLTRTSPNQSQNSTESGSSTCSKGSFSSTLPLEEDIRQVLKYSFQRFDVELDSQLADLISCFAF